MSQEVAQSLFAGAKIPTKTMNPVKPTANQKFRVTTKAATPVVKAIHEATIASCLRLPWFGGVVLMLLVIGECRS